ncbi:Uncharacterised protein [Bacteroides xylanisolvens]|nr:Uncharacterised protein [Bacteroides xylanisolvens]
MCFCNTYQYLMRKEISGFLFQKASPDGAMLFSSFNYGSCYLKMNAIIIPSLKNSALPTSILLSSEPDNNSVRE